MQAMRRSLFRFSWARGISVTSEAYSYVEFQSLRLIVQDLIQGFYITSYSISHSPHILQEIIGSNIFGIDHAAKIQFIYYLVKKQDG